MRISDWSLDVCSSDLSAIGATIDGRESDIWLDETLRRLAALPNVTLLPRTTAFGYYPHNWIGLAEKLTAHPAVTPAGKPRERLWPVRAKQVVIAAGANDIPPVFADHGTKRCGWGMSCQYQ